MPDDPSRRNPGLISRRTFSVGVMLLAVVALAAAGIAAADGGSPCTCDDHEEIGVWCDAHEIGHVAGVEITSAELFETLDAHGHVIPSRSITCKVCRNAKASTGYCEDHHMGWVNGLAYMSRLTYHLARGENREPGEITCEACREHTKSLGWCETCQLGRVGHVERRIADDKPLVPLSDTGLV